MKKKINVLVMSILLLSMATISQAQPYKGGIGVVGGTMYGVQGKLFLMPKLALQADLAWKFGVYPLGQGFGYSSFMSDFELNPNLLYQSNIQEWNWGQLDWFAGGGFSLGCAFNGYGYRYGGTLLGKFGINAAGGVELSLSKIPLAFALDCRPGYGLLIDKYGGMSYFDWAVTVGVRYCFGK
jgi:hypothetical protein